MKEDYFPPLKSGLTYHIFNRGNNGEDIFPEARNYPYFLKKYKEYISPISDTYAWCLMPNHFHIMLRFRDYTQLHQAFPKRFPSPPPGVRTGNDISTTEHVAFDDAISLAISKQFADFFGGYSRAINKAVERSGKLFSLPFKRVLVDDEAYFGWLLCYIHRNPLHHGFCAAFEEWEYSSYREILCGLDRASAVSTLNAELRPVSTSSANRSLDICDIEFLKFWFADKDAFLHSHRQSELAMLNQQLLLE